MRSQYLAIKKQYPDIILLFRLGDFYETFDDDARIVSSVCDVVLTSRPVGADERVPLAGVPYHAIDGYIAKLINAGYKVAIAEQIGSEPPKGEKLVPRVVRRVVTPGTLVEPGLLPEKRNNYIAALVPDQDLFSLLDRGRRTARGPGIRRHQHRRVRRHRNHRWRRSPAARRGGAGTTLPGRGAVSGQGSAVGWANDERRTTNDE